MGSKDYQPVKISGGTLKRDGKAMGKAMALKRVKAGKNVYTTKAYAKSLSKALGGGKKNKEGDFVIKEIGKGKKGEVHFEHFHDPHRDTEGQSRGAGKEPKKARKKMGHIYFGEGYEVK